MPNTGEGLIVAEKSISVTNIVAGASRLQPVVLTIGQAAGALAAVAIKNKQQPAAVNIREVQLALLESKAYIMPFIDVKATDKDFKVLQKIGATGILKGTGIPYKWANQTWFYPEQPINEYELANGMRTYYSIPASLHASGKLVDVTFAAELFSAAAKRKISTDELLNALNAGMAGQVKPGSTLSRRSIAILMDHFLDPFAIPVDFNGIPKTK
ncbi:FAD dependent oxidoreductase [compost metagenome]